jgi:hypothetical protein
MEEIGIIGIDRAKKVFQLNGEAADGSVVFRMATSNTSVPRRTVPAPFWGRNTL